VTYASTVGFGQNKVGTEYPDVEGVGDELSAHVAIHRPAHDPPRVDVLDGDEVEPALPGPEVGDVGDPESVRAVGSERPVDEVLTRPDAWHPNRGAAPLAGDQAAQASLAHQSLDPLTPDSLAVGEPELGVNPGRSVDAAVRRVDLLDALGEPLILNRAG
jgi:hypothetical protein